MTTSSRRPRQDPWERLPAESDPAWEAFKAYRDLGVKRSTAKVAKQLSKSVTLMNRWSGTHRWVQRAQTYDAHLDREWLREQAELRRKAAQRNAASAGLAIQKFGQYVMAIDVNDPRVSASDIAAIARVAVQLEQGALAVPTAVVAGGGPAAPGAPDPALAAAMTDEERQARLRMLLREAESRLSDADPDDDDDEEEAS